MGFVQSSLYVRSFFTIASFIYENTVLTFNKLVSRKGKLKGKIRFIMIVKKANQSRYWPGVTQRVPGS
jgi:hypothetical protein